jgi:hypothetical protein
MKVLSEIELARLHNLQTWKRELVAQIAKQLKDIDDLRNTLYEVNCEIREIAGKSSIPLRVSKHALLRYCERILGIDMHEIEQEILSGDIEAQIERGHVVYEKENYKLTVRGNMVITVTEKREIASKN